MKIDQEILVESVTKKDNRRELVRLDPIRNSLAYQAGEFNELTVAFVAPLGAFRAGEKMRLVLETTDG